MPKEETAEIVKIKNVYIVKAGVTTQASASGDDIADVNNITEDVLTNYWKDMSVVLMDGANKGLIRRIVSMLIASGDPAIHVYPAFPYAITVGTNYRILSNIVTQSNLTPTTDNGDTTLVNNTDEQTIFSIGYGALNLNYSMQYIIYINASNLTQNTTIREYTALVADVYLQTSAKVYPADFDTGTKIIALAFETGSLSYKITMQSVTAEGSDKVIPIIIIRTIKT